MDEKLIRSIGTKRPCREKCTPPGKKPKLNKNQQIVLEWLKDRTTVSSITYVLWALLDDALELEYDTDASEAWNRLPIDQKFQVLVAFAEWGMKNDQ